MAVPSCLYDHTTVLNVKKPSQPEKASRHRHAPWPAGHRVAETKVPVVRKVSISNCTRSSSILAEVSIDVIISATILNATDGHGLYSYTVKPSCLCEKLISKHYETRPTPVIYFNLKPAGRIALLPRLLHPCKRVQSKLFYS